MVHRNKKCNHIHKGLIMFQNQLNDQIAQAQAKAVENAKHLAQVAVESAQELAEINQAAAKDALAAAQDASSQLLAIKDAQQLAKLAQPEAAKEAAKRRANVYLLCRDQKRGEAARQKMQQ